MSGVFHFCLFLCLYVIVVLFLVVVFVFVFDFYWVFCCFLLGGGWLGGTLFIFFFIVITLFCSTVFVNAHIKQPIIVYFHHYNKARSELSTDV